jgi:cyclin B
MDSYLNIQSHYIKKSQNGVKDFILPRKKYEKRNNKVQIYRNKMENRRFGKEIKDINNLTEMQNQTNSQITRISDILSKMNKDIEKSKNRDKISLGVKIPSITKLSRIQNQNQKINTMKTNPNISINTHINSNVINPYIYNKTSRNSSITNKHSSYLSVIPNKSNYNTLKHISSQSKSIRRKYCRNSMMSKKIRKNSNFRIESSRSNISFSKYGSINTNENGKFSIQNYKEKDRQYNYKTLNIITKKNNNNTINYYNHYNKYEYRKINNNKENINTSNFEIHNSNKNSNSKRETNIMRFILKQYNIPKVKERSNKLLNLSLNYRQISRNKDLQINQKRKKNYLNIPNGKEIATIIPINKESSDNKYNYNHKSIDIQIPYPYPININPQVPKEYIDDIYTHLKLIEYDDLPMKNYMNIIQTDINEKMRAILLDWLIEVHIRFNLLTETLFITINLIDKYLSKKNIHRKYLQLLGITALLIACKYEEIYPPEIKELILMTDNAYNKEQVLQMENEILHAVNFNVTFPTSLKFLEIFKNKLNLDEKNYHRCLYFIEVSLLDYKSSYFNPSLIASNSLYFNYMFMNNNNIVELNYDEKNIFDITGYGKNDIVQCMNCLNNALKSLEKDGNKYNSLRRKFKIDKYSKVSSIKYFIENEDKEISFNSE